MAEAERPLVREAGSARLDQLLLRERPQPSVEAPAVGLRRELEDGAAVEDLALDRASLEHSALLAVEPVEAGGEQSLNRRWKGHSRPLARGSHGAVSADEKSL